MANIITTMLIVDEALKRASQIKQQPERVHVYIDQPLRQPQADEHEWRKPVEVDLGSQVGD